MSCNNEIELAHCVENKLPRLFNWSGRYDGNNLGIHVCLVATTDSRLGSKAGQAVVPPATMVSLYLDDASLQSLSHAVGHAMKVRHLGTWARR